MTYEEHIDEIFDSETFEESIKRRIKDSIAKYLASERSRTIEECKAVIYEWSTQHEYRETPRRNWADLGNRLDALAKGGKP